MLYGSAARDADAYFRRFEWEAGRLVVMEYLRRAEYRGSDVRLDIGVGFRYKPWPRGSIRASRFL